MPRRDSEGGGWRGRKTDSRGDDRRVTVSRSFRACDVISRSVAVRPFVPVDASRVATIRAPRCTGAARRMCTHAVYAIVPARSFPPSYHLSHTKSNILALPPLGYNAILARARRHLQVACSPGRLDALHRV